MDLLREKMRLLPMSGPQDSGGGGGGGSATQTQVTDLPEWAKPYAEKTLAKTEALTTDKPYQSYGQWAQQKGYDPTQVAGFTGLQQQAFQGAQGMQGAPQMPMASGIAGAAAQQALGAGQGFDPYQASYLGVQAPQLRQYQMGPVERVGTESFRQPGAAEAYMSPYMEQAMEPQLREAARASQMQRNVNQAQSVQQGAFGGSRQAIVEAERQRNLATQQGDIRAMGYQNAFQHAQQQFNAEQQARLQANLANQQAGLTSAIQNLGARMGTQQLGAQTGMQAQLANQQAYQQAQQLAEQSRQYGAGLGLQGLQTALQGAGQLGQLGAQQFQQGMDINKLQQAYGTQQQQLNQAQINALIQDYQNQQKYPYQQLEFMSNILRGTPMGTVQTLYGGQPSAASQLMGAGTSLAGAYMMGGGKFAEGGEVKAAAGLADLALSKM